MQNILHISKKHTRNGPEYKRTTGNKTPSPSTLGRKITKRGEMYDMIIRPDVRAFAETNEEM